MAAAIMNLLLCFFLVVATDLDSPTNSQLTYSVSDANFSVETANNIGYIKTARYDAYDCLSNCENLSEREIKSL